MNHFLGRIFLLLGVFCSTQIGAAPIGNFNFSSFKSTDAPDLEHWKKHNHPRFHQHPEFGTLPESAPNEPCVEILEKRTANSRFFVNIYDPSKTYEQTSYGVLNELQNGWWISVRNKLQPTLEGVYETRSQLSTAGLHTQQQHTFFKEKNGHIYFNNWTLILKKKGEQDRSIRSNWSTISVGAEGAYIQNIFDGIDAEIIIVSGRVKTNFIVNTNRYGSFDEMIFRDKYLSREPIQLEFESMMGTEGTDNVLAYRGKTLALEIGKAHAYIAGMLDNTATTLPYRIDKNNLDIVVPFTWIAEHIAKGPLVIDPLVSTTATKTQSTISGSEYGTTCFTDYCSYELSLSAPVSAVVTDVRFTFNYLATSPCAVRDGGFSLHYNTCRSPAIAGAHYCNLPDAGICNAEDVSIFSAMSSCVESVYCSPTDLEFEMRFYRCKVDVGGCGSTCIGAASDWIMTIYANELERGTPVLSEDTICAGTPVTGTISYSEGAEPFTHVWSVHADGSSPLATGDEVSLMVPGSGLTKIFVITTDACGIDYLDSVYLMIHPSYEFIEYDTVCSSTMPIVWNGITVYAGGPMAATLNHVSAAGCDSNIVLNLTLIPSETVTETVNICPEMLPYEWNGISVSSGGYNVARDTTISSTTGCDSITILNLVVTSDIMVTETVHLCDDELPYTWNGITLTTGGIGAATYESTSAISGCDSLTTLNLIVHTPSEYSVSAYFCIGSSYEFGTSTYTSPGTYTHTFTSIHGCDSTVHLTLIQDPMDTIDQYQWKCRLASYEFYGTEYSESGTYLHLDTTGSCHVMRRLILTDYDTIYTYNSYGMCAGDSLVWGGDSYFESGVYTFSGVNSAGCDTSYTLTLVVYLPDTVEMSQYICPLDTIDFYGTDLTEPGIYFHTEYYGACAYVYRLELLPSDTLYSYAWADFCSGGSYEYGGMTITESGEYTFSGVNAAGCDTVLTLFVNESAPYYEYYYHTICVSQSYEFFDSVYTEAGTYTHTTSVGCDTTRVLHLSTIDTIRSYDYISLCEGNVFHWAGVDYTEAGTYLLMGSTADGCDTLHSLQITVWPADTLSRYDTICPEAEYDFYGMDLTAGTGTYIYRDTVGDCDTVWRLYLTMMDTITTEYIDTLCTGASYIWKGVTYNTSGVYNLAGVNEIGCDTIHTINLYFNPPDTLSTVDTICSGNSAYFYGSYYNTTGTYYYSTSTGVCDITYQLDLFVRDTLRTISYDTICSGMYFEFAGDYHFSTGTYYYYGLNAYGCDTLRELNVYVNPPHMDTTLATICPGESYNFFGIEYNTAGIYTRSSIAEGCDTAYILILHIPLIPNNHDTFAICSGNSVVHDGTTLTESGVYTFYYTSVDGCDSNYTITLQVTEYIEYPVTASVCENETYSFFDSLIYDPGTYYHLVDGEECDTMYILTLNHLPTYRQVQSLTLCNNQLPYNYLGMDIPYGTSSTTSYDSVMLSTHSGCDSLIVLNLEIHDTSRSDLDTLLCFGTQYTFGHHNITAPGSYALTFENAIGCDSLVVLQVAYTAEPIHTDSALQGCSSVTYRDSVFYQSTAFIDTFRNDIQCDSLYRHVQIEVLREPHDTIQVEICQGQSYEFNGRSFSSPTVVTDTFLYHNGCDSTITLQLTVRPLPDIKISYEAIDQFCIFDSVYLSVTGAEHYQIYDAFHRLLGDNTSILTILPQKENQFTAIGQNEYGCVDSATITIHAEACCTILMPNAFTPNGDGINDKFGAVALGTPLQYRLQVFNRWGELVFVSFDVDQHWNGLDEKGKPADLGTYFYVVTGTCVDGSKFNMKGDVTLIR